MCYHKSSTHLSGSRLTDGTAHDEAHTRWSRRQFLGRMGMAAAATTITLGSTSIHAFATSPLLRGLAGADSDRILVLIQLSGGNDGLNTVVPITNDLYYNARPSIAIPASTTIPIGPDTGLHPSLAPFETLMGDGRLAIMHGVGYPSPNLSHFRSTDIWVSANEAETTAATGWSGRYLDFEFPDFLTDPPAKPLAVQLGGGSSLLFQGPASNMGMSLLNIELFERIAGGGQIYDEEGVSDTLQGNEISFVRSVANDSFQYAGAVQDASDNAQNDVEYPTGNPLAANLAIVARLIKGDLGSRIYHVNLGSFDTHSGQAGNHGTLLRYLSEAVDAFLKDVEFSGMQDRVLTMTFSEFGRRVQQNGSNGTDHGTAAPLFLFGQPVEGGIYGTQPSLSDLDPTGNMKFGTDFRSIYTTVLQDWFGIAAADASGLLGGEFNTLSFISDPVVTGTEPGTVPAGFVLDQNYPNPFNPSTVIPFSLDRAGHVSLTIYDVSGRVISRPFQGSLSAGTHEIPFRADHLASGIYLYVLETLSGRRTRQMILLR